MLRYKDDFVEKLRKQVSDIATITEKIDRDLHSTEIIREVDDLKAYAKRLNEHLEKTYQLDKTENPFVVINCSVEVYDTQNDEVCEFHIVNSKAFELEGNDVTFSSPIGKALLFKKIGDRVEFKIPVGTIVYIVRSVKPDDDLSVEYEL